MLVRAFNATKGHSACIAVESVDEAVQQCTATDRFTTILIAGAHATLKQTWLDVVGRVPICALAQKLVLVPFTQ